MTKLISFLRNNIIFVILFIVIVILILAQIQYTKIVNKDLTKIDLSNTNNLMIIVHPTDELIFGGSHLINDNFLVVCITCNKKDIDTIKVLNKTNDKYLFLNYKEYNGVTINTFNKEQSQLANDLYTIINYKKWNMIVTHNPNGEYGHQQHKLISNIVTNITTDNLYYFGHYYSPNTIKDHYYDLSKINDTNIKIKHNLLGLYVKEDIEEYLHIIDYETWIPFQEWSTS